MEYYRYFKYRSINDNLLDSLREGTLYFSPQNKLNDPFDCELDIIKAIENAIKKSKPEHAKELEKLLKGKSPLDNFQANVDKLGIFSSSEEVDESQTLLWAHYANDHKGACILYEFPESFLNNEDNILGTSKVTYNPNSLTEWFVQLGSELPVTDKELITSLLIRILTAKSPPWAYEREVRIIRPEHGLFKIEKQYIKQICFGLHTSDEDIDKVREAIKDYEHDIKLYKAIRGKDDFGIDYIEI